MEVQQVLKKSFPACVMWMQIDAEAPGVEVPMEGIRVYADHIEEDWNRESCARPSRTSSSGNLTERPPNSLRRSGHVEVLDSGGP